MNTTRYLKHLLVALFVGLALVLLTTSISTPASAMALEENATTTKAPVVLAWYYGPGHRYYGGGYRRGWGPGWGHWRWGGPCRRVCWHGPYGGLHCGTRCY